VCDYDTATQDASTTVDLTQQTPVVLAQQPAGTYLVTYYNSLPAAQAGTAPLIPSTSHTAHDGDPIWVRVENTVTGCFNIGTFHIQVNAPLLLTTPTPLSLCDDDALPNDQFHVFDLT
ncbi:hypothetical protein, partial [Flavobacterium wongokense]|uniref:hypothetical protein n=1 Tax=Flavobacterium wongokense TaxID=2910674 RepID=UPI001F3443E9